MAKVLANETKVASMLQNNSLLIEVGGSIRRIELKDFLEAINQGDELMLRQVAWGVPIKDKIQSSTNWGRIGNLQAWEEYKSMCGRFLVTEDGRAAKLHQNDSTVYADGTALDQTKGNVMFIAPRLYYRVQEDSVTGVPTLWMSQVPIGGDYIGNADNGRYNVVAAYKSYRLGTKLVSRSGYAPTGSRTIEQNWTDAQGNGPNWGLQDYNLRKLMVMLLLSEFGDSNAQKVIGGGVGGTTSAALWELTSGLLTGATATMGDNSGKIPIVVGENLGVDTCRVSLMGLEDVYGWQWEQIQGVYYGNSANAEQTGSEAFIYEGNRMPTSVELTTKPKGEFRQLARLTSSGYIKELISGKNFDWLGSVIGGDSSSYWASYNYGSTTGQLCLAGGNSAYGALCGLVDVAASAAFSDSGSARGSRLAYFGNLTFVDGRNIV